MTLKPSNQLIAATALCLTTVGAMANSSGLTASATSALTFTVDATISMDHLDDIRLGQALDEAQIWGWSNFCVARNSATNDNPEKYLLIADGQNSGFQLSTGEHSIDYSVRVLDEEKSSPPLADEGYELQPGIAQLNLETSSNTTDHCSNATVWVSVANKAYDDGDYTDTLTLTVAPQ